MSAVDSFLSQAEARADSDPVETTTRELLSYWGAKGRGSRVVGKIRSDLASKRLETRPDFTFGHIDGSIRIVRASPEPESNTNADSFESNYLRVHTLAASNGVVVRVNPQDSLAKARTLMALHDYSQLAVMSGPRSIHGAISWESIGRAELAREPVTVRDALFEPAQVSLHHDLLDVLPRIAESGFVFAINNDRSLSGIITSADVVNEFGGLARPFFLVGEIERRLRRTLDDCLSPEIFEKVERLGVSREAATAEDLSFGEIMRLLEDLDNWTKTGWALDRAATIAQLDEVRKVRNSLMRFSNDLPSSQDIQLLKNFLGALKDVVGK